MASVNNHAEERGAGHSAGLLTISESALINPTKFAGYSVEQEQSGEWSVGVLVSGVGRIILETRRDRESACFWMSTYLLPPGERARTAYVTYVGSFSETFNEEVIRVEFATTADHGGAPMEDAIREGYEESYMPLDIEISFGDKAITIGQRDKPGDDYWGLAATHHGLEHSGYLPRFPDEYVSSEILSNAPECTRSGNGQGA